MTKKRKGYREKNIGDTLWGICICFLNFRFYGRILIYLLEFCFLYFIRAAMRSHAHMLHKNTSEAPYARSSQDEQSQQNPK